MGNLAQHRKTNYQGRFDFRGCQEKYSTFFLPYFHVILKRGSPHLLPHTAAALVFEVLGPLGSDSKLTRLCFLEVLRPQIVFFQPALPCPPHCLSEQLCKQRTCTSLGVTVYLEVLFGKV